MKEYFPRLDAFRFLAFLVVFGNHLPSFLHFPQGVNTPGTAAFVYLQDGDLAVGFFFVLSAFLVTYLFERERNKNGTIALTNFYKRRMLRIWPLYFFVIAVIFFVSYFAQGLDSLAVFINWKEFGSALGFLTGLTRPFYHSSNEMLAVLWSISVEEQFYLLWPVVFRFGRKYAGLFLAIVAVISIASRYIHANDFEAREFYTFSTMIYLCVGAAAGMYASRVRPWVEKHARLIMSFSLCAVVALLSVRGFVFPHVYPQWFVAIDGPLFGLCFVGIVLVGAFGAVSTVERSKNAFMAFFEYLGSISYGLYVYHLVALTLVLLVLHEAGISYRTNNAFTFFGIALTTLLLTIGMSALSYRYIEKRFLLLKKKLSKV